jgi:hypothetical protein
MPLKGSSCLISKPEICCQRSKDRLPLQEDLTERAWLGATTLLRVVCSEASRHIAYIRSQSPVELMVCDASHQCAEFEASIPPKRDGFLWQRCQEQHDANAKKDDVLKQEFAGEIPRDRVAG